MGRYFKVGNVDEKLVNAVQKAGIEVEGRMNIINYLMEDHKEDPSFIDSAIFSHYHKQYFDAYAEFQMLKQGIQDTHPALVALKPCNFRWNLDYSSREIAIEVTNGSVPDASALGLMEVRPEESVFGKK